LLGGASLNLENRFDQQSIKGGIVPSSRQFQPISATAASIRAMSCGRDSR
jgi:hypothetical protein